MACRAYDSETGLYYYRARYYSPTIGRFLQTDPVGYQSGLNLYTYVHNNPLNLVDPYGLYLWGKVWDKNACALYCLARGGAESLPSPDSHIIDELLKGTPVGQFLNCLGNLKNIAETNVCIANCRRNEIFEGTFNEEDDDWDPWPKPVRPPGRPGRPKRPGLPTACGVCGIEILPCLAIVVFLNRHKCKQDRRQKGRR
jgi:RHS repeat-associated protein